MDLSLQTPALLFPAISLLFLAYTNKFLAIANLIRQLYSAFEKKGHISLIAQISNLRRRLFLIRAMQVLGVGSFLFCMISMFCIYQNWQVWAKVLFSFSLLLMIASLVISMVEIFLSTGALNVLLKDLEKGGEGRRLEEKGGD